jgi:phosphoenolpyruvate carboxylase
VPRRRTRKLHVGLFGYARSVDKVALPRAIGFCAACYSLGLPPEILGLNALSRGDVEFLKDVHVNFAFDLQDAMAFFNEEVLTLLPDEVKASLRLDWGAVTVNEEHRAVTSRIIRAVKENDRANLQGLIIEAAHLRRFLG